MSIVGIVLVLLVIGFILWMLQTAPIPIHPWIKTLIIGIIVFAVIVWMLELAGVHTGIPLRLR